jgi:hypothetical protein
VQYPGRRKVDEYIKDRMQQLCHEWHPTGMFIQQETTLMKGEVVECHKKDREIYI